MSQTIRATFAAVAVSLLCCTAATATEKIKYTYDARGRLIKVERDPALSTVNANVQSCYKYDKADNRSKVTTTTTAPLPTCP